MATSPRETVRACNARDEHVGHPIRPGLVDYRSTDIASLHGDQALRLQDSKGFSHGGRAYAKLLEEILLLRKECAICVTRRICSRN